MVSAVSVPGGGSTIPSLPSPASSGNSVASLQGRIRQEKIQLDDWSTCVSAKSTKGQSEIQKLSGEISATREQALRAQQAQSVAPSQPSQAASPLYDRRAVSSRVPDDSVRANYLDVWA